MSSARVCATLKRNDVVPFAALLKTNWSMGHIISMLHTTLAGDKLMSWMDQMNQGRASFADPIDTRQLFRLLDFYKANLHANAAEMDQAEQHAAFCCWGSCDDGTRIMGLSGLSDDQPGLELASSPSRLTITRRTANSLPMSTRPLRSPPQRARRRCAPPNFSWNGCPHRKRLRCGWKTANWFHLQRRGRFGHGTSFPGDLVRYMNEGKTNPWAFSMYPVAVFEDACKTGAQEYMLGLRDADGLLSSSTKPGNGK